MVRILNLPCQKCQLWLRQRWWLGEAKTEGFFSTTTLRFGEQNVDWELRSMTVHPCKTVSGHIFYNAQRAAFINIFSPAKKYITLPKAKYHFAKRNITFSKKIYHYN